MANNVPKHNDSERNKNKDEDRGSVIMLTYAHTHTWINTHSLRLSFIHKDYITLLKEHSSVLTWFLMENNRIKVKPSSFFKNTNTFCFKSAVNIKYTKLEKNV